MEVSLAKIVKMCTECRVMCDRRTERITDDSGIKPWGFEWLVNYNAKRKRKEATQRCISVCERVHEQCPNSQQIEQFVQEQRDRDQARQRGIDLMDNASASVADGSSQVYYAENAVSVERVRHCESVADEFVALLHVLANKPTKVEFEGSDDAEPAQPRPVASRYSAPAGTFQPPENWEEMSDKEKILYVQSEALKAGGGNVPDMSGIGTKPVVEGSGSIPFTKRS